MQCVGKRWKQKIIMKNLIETGHRLIGKKQIVKLTMTKTTKQKKKEKENTSFDHCRTKIGEKANLKEKIIYFRSGNINRFSHMEKVINVIFFTHTERERSNVRVTYKECESHTHERTQRVRVACARTRACKVCETHMHATCATPTNKVCETHHFALPSSVKTLQDIYIFILASCSFFLLSSATLSRCSCLGFCHVGHQHTVICVS